jgi:hypothetical protein
MSAQTMIALVDRALGLLSQREDTKAACDVLLDLRLALMALRDKEGSAQ